MKIVTVIGTRPELIKLSETIKELDRRVDHVLIHTGQNFSPELNQIFFTDLQLRVPDYDLNAAGETACSSVANFILQLEPILASEDPDALLILGDTNSCLAAAYVAKRLKIPLFHCEAGNRCFDDLTPEEINRRAIDHISDINMPYSDRARDNLIREGLPLDRIIKTGSPMAEVLWKNGASIEASDILNVLNLKPQEYFLVSCHREENLTPARIHAFQMMLVLLGKAYNQPVIVSLHPHTRPLLTITSSDTIRFFKPFGFNDYNKLQKNARVVLSDSGTLSEEAALLGFKALNIRQTHERHEAMEEAVVVMSDFDRVLENLPIIEAQNRAYLPDDYVPLNFSEKVVRIILSYVDYVNRNVWGK